MDFILQYGQLIIGGLTLVAILGSYWLVRVKQEAIRVNELKHIQEGQDDLAKEIQLLGDRLDRLDERVNELGERVAKIEGELISLNSRTAKTRRRGG